jgi:hypothetical protein
MILVRRNFSALVRELNTTIAKSSPSDALRAQLTAIEQAVAREEIELALVMQFCAMVNHRWDMCGKAPLCRECFWDGAIVGYATLAGSGIIPPSMISEIAVLGGLPAEEAAKLQAYIVNNTN